MRRAELDQTSFRVVGDRSQRLLELVSQSAGHLADRGRPRSMTELLNQRLLAIGGELQLHGPLPDPVFQLVTTELQRDDLAADDLDRGPHDKLANRQKRQQ